MPLDEQTLRLGLDLERELRVLREREVSRRDRGEYVSWDPVTRMVTWETRRGEVIGRWYGEVVASYALRDRLLRWAWAGRPTSATASHAEAIAREGADRGVAQLSMSIVAELGEDEALDLARLGVVLAGGQGLHVERGPVDIELVGLFDSPRPRELVAGQLSVPPPVVGLSNPPARRNTEPPTKIREPARAIFVPVATTVLSSLAKAAPAYKQALFVITVDPLHVTLTVLDSAGHLRSIDAAQSLVDATSRMIAADRADGNGPWRKLSARITPKIDGGASLAVDVL
ncbi:MAG: hypothetical protein KIT84_27480 [Labilithrix sp.]|nr:hypothetical protein [Labilithrix sp.]MCW5814800.1 hypothetical protein [Labilithrix sp.]